MFVTLRFENRALNCTRYRVLRIPFDGATLRPQQRWLQPKSGLTGEADIDFTIDVLPFR